jgi:hypothetical protein
MPRFNPDSYPDRLALDAHVRKLRGDEIARIVSAAIAWLRPARGYIAALASTPISRDTRIGTPGLWNSSTRS